MAQHIHTQTVPRPALFGAAFLIVGSMALAASARSAHLAEQKAPMAAPSQVIEVRFEDRADGTLVVLDAETGREIRTVAPGTNHFVRGVLRGMFRGRKLESLGKEPGFRLAHEADGRTTLEDPQTGRHVDLDSFGPTNAAVFADILTTGTAMRAAR
jgi:putative photosynthetic complex assembly protein